MMIAMQDRMKDMENRETALKSDNEKLKSEIEVLRIRLFIKYSELGARVCMKIYFNSRANSPYNEQELSFNLMEIWESLRLMRVDESWWKLMRVHESLVLVCFWK